MLSVERTDSTLQICKFNGQMSNSFPYETSKGLSSGHLEVIKTGSELCLRPGSPERYKSTNNYEEVTPYTKISSKRNSISQCSFNEISNFRNLNQTPINDLSLSYNIGVEDIPEHDNSFFSSINEAKDLNLFSFYQEKEEFFESFASTSSKTDKIKNEINLQRNNNYRNNCIIECISCHSEIKTDLKMIYPDHSM